VKASESFTVAGEITQPIKRSVEVIWCQSVTISERVHALCALVPYTYIGYLLGMLRHVTYCYIGISPTVERKINDSFFFPRYYFFYQKLL
jgi:hypothetical protein